MFYYIEFDPERELLQRLQPFAILRTKNILI